MNPKIKQILLQVVPMAGEDGEYLPSLHTPEDIEHFAELIVKECASIASDTAVENPPNDLFYGYNLGVNKTAEKIKEHFGVEE
jgi:hypothetical protein